LEPSICRFSLQRDPASYRRGLRPELRHSAFAPDPANLRRLAPLLEQSRTIAARHGVAPGAIALAWAVSHAPVLVIPGASAIGQLEANAAVADAGR